MVTLKRCSLGKVSLVGGSIFPICKLMMRLVRANIFLVLGMAILDLILE